MGSGAEGEGWEEVLGGRVQGRLNCGWERFAEVTLRAAQTRGLRGLCLVTDALLFLSPDVWSSQINSRSPINSKVIVLLLCK